VVFPRFHDIQAGGYKVRIAESVMVQARAWTRRNGRDNTPEDETGGLLWGFWDEAIRAIWIFEASGPPPDSVNSPGYFLCGVEGTADEHQRRSENSFGACGFIGHWHTHPNLPPTQSLEDIRSMATLVSAVGGNQRKSAMLIFGRTGGRPTAGLYIYESLLVRDSVDTVIAEFSQIELPVEVV
jgi:proteasome lid subunit RPN8/RPN11